MTQNDDAVVVAAVGYVYTAPVGTTAPSAVDLETIDLADPTKWTATSWDNIGHTDRGALPDFGFDGGKLEMKGSWQVAQLRMVEQGGPPLDYLKLVLNQFDEGALSLYYGDNASDTPGEFGVSGGSWVPNEKAFLVVIEDGDVRIGFHASKSDVRRDTAPKFGIDSFAQLPIVAYFVKKDASTPLFKWINEDLFPNSSS